MAGDALVKATAASAAAMLGFYFMCRTQTNHVLSDVGEAISLLKMRRELNSIQAAPNWTVYELFKKNLRQHPDNDALCFIREDNTTQTMTFRDLDLASNRVGNWAIEEGIKTGDVIGLIMDNRCEFIATWLGLAKIGAVTALINTNLVNDPLLHSMTISNAERFIIGAEHQSKARFGMNNLPGKKWFCSGSTQGFGMIPLDPLLTNPSPITKEHRKTCGPSSDLMYIYTSGTTGNPKAGVIKHIRFFMAGFAFVRNFNITENDRIYCSLPLYHSAGGMVGVSMSWYSGACLVFRRKFSAKRFWIDIREQNCTIMQYIGELCRYLLAQPETKFDKSPIRIAIGNGLRPDIWKDFQSRFTIDVIGEFYAATEGNTSMMNYKNKAGAVGWIPPLIMKLYPLELVKLEDDNETPMRDKNGLCILAQAGEKGELLGKIDNTDPTRFYDGYLNKKATNKKILGNVVKKGDRYFRSGDLLKRDDNGFFYFVDRLGDTFRWKGENVATSEVEFVISRVPGVTLVNVYGVLVPHTDGRAGLAALVLEDSFSFEQLYETVTNDLPSYARPLFLRITKGMDTTSTHKLQKVKARKEGIDIHTIKDALYFRDDKQKKFVPLDETLYKQLQEGTMKSRL